MKTSYFLKSILMAASIGMGFANSAHSLCSIPNTITNGQVTDATPLMANFAALQNCLNNVAGGSANSVQINNGSGALGGVGPLTNGQLVIGATSGAPQVGVLTAGPGISVINGPGSITISTGGGGAWPPFQPPTTSMFPATKSITGITGHQVDDSAAGYLNYFDMSTMTNGDRYFANVNEITNTGDWSATFRMTYNTLNFNYLTTGLFLFKEGQSTVTVFGYNFTDGPRYGVFRYPQFTSGFVDSRFTWGSVSQSAFLRVAYTVSSDLLEFYFSNNGKIWFKMGSLTATSLLGGAPDRIGFGNAPNVGGASDFGQVGISVDYWDCNAF